MVTELRDREVLKRHRFTVEDFSRMGKAGILDKADRIELIEGELIEMAPIGDLHAGKVNRLTALLVRVLGERAVVSPQNPLVLDPFNEPQPDLLVLAPREDFYESGKPGVEDVLLLIEIADSTLAKDRRVKLPIYAGNRVPEVWIIDLQSERVLVYRRPANGRYLEEEVQGHDGMLTPAALPDITIRVRQIFG